MAGNPLSCPVISDRKHWCIVECPGHSHHLVLCELALALRGGLQATHTCHSIHGGLRALSNDCGGLPDGHGQGVRQYTNVYGHRRLDMTGGSLRMLEYEISSLGTGLLRSDQGQGIWFTADAGVRDVRPGNGTTSLRSGPGHMGTRSKFEIGPVT